MLSRNKEECSKSSSKFEIKDGGILKHVDTSKCIIFERQHGSFGFGDCSKACRFHYVPDNMTNLQGKSFPKLCQKNDSHETQEFSQNLCQMEQFTVHV